MSHADHRIMKFFRLQPLTFAFLLAFGCISPGACTCVPDRSSSVQASTVEDTLRVQPEAIAKEYIGALNLTSWSRELGRWVVEHRYNGAVDTFHQIESYQWPYEQFCFKTRIESGGCTTEYSFFEDGD